MSQSLYIKIAVLMVRADIRLEQRRWENKIRKQAHHLPTMNAFLLRDIGFTQAGHIVMMNSISEAAKIERRLVNIRQILSSRIHT